MVKIANSVKISVLVPIFNVEEYLSECLNSLAKQTIEEIEIICINDGSTDGSLDIVKKYMKRDKRFILIDKKNTGYGDSMNVGIEKASGEYVGIVEPDDFIDVDAFEKMYGIAKKNGADVVKANFFNYSTKKKKDTCKSNMFLREEIGRVINPLEHKHIFYQQPSIWSAIYKTDFLKENQITFLASPGASYQDAGFTFKVWSMAKKVYYMDEAFLHYRNDNPNSSVKSDGKIYAVKEEYDEVERFLKKKGLIKELWPTLTVVRFGGYIWNLRRLKRTVALKFANEVEKDYVRYKKMGFLDASNFTDKDALYIINNIAIKKPRLYVNIRPMYELNRKFKELAAGIRGMVVKK